MVELDGYVGQLLKKLDDLGVADNTIVVFTTDNGAEVMSWPDGGSTPFRGEKATNWEGGYRVPMVIRWPGTIKPGTIYNDTFSHYDLVPTFAAAAAIPTSSKSAQGHAVRRQDLQSPSRWLQPHAVSQRRGGGRAAQRIPVLERRRPACGYPLQGLESRCSKSRNTRDRRLAGRFRRAALAEAVQLTLRPFRARRQSILYDKWLADRAFVQVPMQALSRRGSAASRNFRPGKSLRAST